MSVSRLMLALLGLALAIGVVAMLGTFEDPGEATVDAPTEVEAPPDIEVTTPVAEAVEARPVRAVSPLAPLPPDPIADRIAAGEKLFTLHAEVLDNVSGRPVQLFRSWLVPSKESIHAAVASEDIGRTWGNPLGTLTYKGLEEGTYNLMIKVDGYEDLFVPGIELPTKDEKLSFTLSRGAYIEVTVNDFEGDGIGELEVRLNPIHLDYPDRAPRVRLRFTDSHGKALFTSLPSGQYSVAMGNAALAEYATEAFYIGPGVAYPVIFTVPTLNTVRVKTVDQEGNPLNLVQVRMWSKDGKGIFRTETDRHGKAKIEHVPAGQYTAKIYKHGCRRKTQTFTVDSTTGDVPFEIQLVHDWKAQEEEENPTKEQLEKLKRGVRPHDVFGGDGG